MKILMIFVVAIMCMSLVSAMDWDNIKEYDETEDRIDIYNSWIIPGVIKGEKLAEVTLIDNTYYCLEECEATLEVKLLTDYENIIPSFETYDIPTKTKVKKISNYRIFIRDNGTEKSVDDYELVCDQRVVANGTENYNCRYEEVGSHLETEYKYNNYEGEYLSAGTYYFKIRGTKEPWESVDWVATMMGIETTEWAEWTSGMNTGLFAYYNMTTFQASATDNEDFNLTGNASIVSDGKIGNGLNLTGEDVVVVTEQTQMDIDHNTNFSFGGWFTSSSGTGAARFLVSKSVWGAAVSNTNVARGFGIATASVDSSTTIALGTEYFAIWTVNTTSACIWLDGVMESCQTPQAISSNTNNVTFGWDADFSAPFNGSMDEWGFWNRTLTPSEVTDLYNGGTGITHDPSPGTQLTVTLNSPTNDFSTAETEVNFSASFSISGTETNLTNSTLYVWFANDTLFGTNYTEINGTTNATNRSFEGLQATNYKWNYEGCGVNSTDSVCSWGISNRTFQINAFTENSQTFNNSVFETSLQDFIIDTTYDSGRFDSIEGRLWYNDVMYDGNRTGAGDSAIFTTTGVQTPATTGNESFLWEIILGEGGIEISQNSTLQNQTLNELFWDNCNETLTTPFINFTFTNETVAEESVNASINSGTFVYWLGNAETNKSTSFSNATENPDYGFCTNATAETLNTFITMTYSNTESQQRQLSQAFSLTSIAHNQTLFLLPTSEGTFVTFQVVDVAEQTITGAKINVTSGSNFIASAVTDSSGLATFFLDPDSTYSLTFQASGFPLTSLSLQPTQTSYTITLGQTTTTTSTDFVKGINYQVRPQIGSVLSNNTNYNFNLTLNSSFFTVTEYGFTITGNGSDTLNSSTSTNNGGIVTTFVNTNGYDTITMDLFWTILGNETHINVTWYVEDSTGTGFGINNFFNRLSTYLTAGMFGVDNFSLSLIIFLIIFVFTGIMSFKFGITNQTIIAFIIFSAVFFFDVTLGLIPNPSSIPSQIPFATVISLGLLIGTILWGSRT